MSYFRTIGGGFHVKKRTVRKIFSKHNFKTLSKLVCRIWDQKEILATSTWRFAAFFSSFDSVLHFYLGSLFQTFRQSNHVISWSPLIEHTFRRPRCSDWPQQTDQSANHSDHFNSSCALYVPDTLVFWIAKSVCRTSRPLSRIALPIEH